MVHQILPPVAEERVNYCRQFQYLVCDGIVDPDLIFYIDGALFYHSSSVNSQNSFYWNAENPYSILEVPLHHFHILNYHFCP